MSKATLYPPIVSSTINAFPVEDDGTGELKVYFTLSKYNASSDFETVQVIIKQQSSGLSVVNVAEDDEENNIYRKTGIILNKIATSTETAGMYYITINGDDIQKTSYLKRNDTTAKGGWAIGEIYKIQLRLTSAGVSYNPTSYTKGQATWLNDYAGEFSEWSTTTITKATGHVVVELKFGEANYNSDTDENPNLEENKKYIYDNLLEVQGTWSNTDDSENLYSYRFKLYQDSGDLIEDSGEIFNNQYEYSTSIQYNFKTELTSGAQYMEYEFTSNNFYTKTGKVEFMVSVGAADQTSIYICTYENPTLTKDDGTICKMIFTNDDFHAHDGYIPEEDDSNYLTEKSEEEQEAKIAYRICVIPDGALNAQVDYNIVVKRSDDTSNFQLWNDIRLITIKQGLINNLPLFYDYDIQSGRSYKYCTQIVTTSGTRSAIFSKSTFNPVRRECEFSYLLGQVIVDEDEDETQLTSYQQLKLCFDDAISSYQNVRQDAVKTTIGGQFPYITRNGNNNFRQFQLQGTISFNMDDMHEFLDINFTPYYKMQYYIQDNDYYPIEQYDFTYERDFRQKVIEFLNDGKPKLFKAKSEETMIIRLTNCSFEPNKDLNRLIYSFSCTAYEIAEYNNTNILSYGFNYIKDYATDFETLHDGNVGQIIKTYKVNTNGNTFQEKYPNVMDDIIAKYDFSHLNLNGHKQVLNQVYDVRFTINSRPRFIKYNNNNSNYAGYKIKIDGTTILISGNTKTYRLDPNIKLTQDSTIYIMPDDEIEVDLIIDFVYNYKMDIYVNKIAKEVKTENFIGQYAHTMTSGQSLYKTIKFQYYIDHTDVTRTLMQFANMRIESPNNAVFQISWTVGPSTTSHVMTDQFAWNLMDEQLSAIEDLKYIGIYDENYSGSTSGYEHVKPDSSSVMVDYIGKIKIQEWAGE